MNPPFKKQGNSSHTTTPDTLPVKTFLSSFLLYRGIVWTLINAFYIYKILWPVIKEIGKALDGIFTRIYDILYRIYAHNTLTDHEIFMVN